MEGRPRSNSDPTYVTAVPEKPASYNVVYAPGGTSRNDQPRDLGTASKKGMSLRMILDASMLTIRDRLDELDRNLSEVLSSLSSGGGDDLHRQFVECFPEIITGLFGLPGGASSSSGGHGAATYASGSGRGWFANATTVLDFEFLHKLLHAKGNLFRLLVMLSGMPQAPLYEFPVSALPADAFQVVQQGGAGAAGLGMMDPVMAFMQSFLGLYINQGRQASGGVAFPMMEFYLCAFCWYATVSGQETIGVGGSTTNSLDLLNDLSINKTMNNVLYTSLVRQYSMLLLEQQAQSDSHLGSYARSTGSNRRGLGSFNTAARRADFETFVKIASLFWLHQTPSPLYQAVVSSSSSSSSMSSSAAGVSRRGNMFVYRSRYVAPSFLTLNAIYDLLTLLIYSADSVMTGYQYPHQMDRSAVGYAAGSITGSLLRDLVLDSVYRVLRLGFMFAPRIWPYLGSIWRLVCTPWKQLAGPNAYADLGIVHERYQASLLEMDRRQSYGANGNKAVGGKPVGAFGAAGDQKEEFPFSTLILSPFIPESLKSPFVLAAQAGSGGSSSSSSSAGASRPNLASQLGLASIFGMDKTTTSSTQAASSAATPSVFATGSSVSSTLLSKSDPQNWSWYTFYDPACKVGCLWDEKSAPLDSDKAKIEYRPFVVFNYPFYANLLQIWIASLHVQFVEEAQPLSYGMLVTIQRVSEFFGSSAVIGTLHELDAQLCKPVDRFSDGRFELEKRTILERWTVLERSSFPVVPVSVFHDASNKSYALGLLKQAALFTSISGDQSSFKTLLTHLCEDFETIFGFSHAVVEMEIKSALTEAGRHDRSSVSAGGRGAGVGASLASAGLKRLTAEEQKLLREGKLRMDRGGIGYTGDVWDKPVASTESWVLLWLLYRLSLLLGLAERKPGGTTKTYFNLRPLGSKFVLWCVVVFVVFLWVVSRLGSIDFSFLDLGDDDESW